MKRELHMEERGQRREGREEGRRGEGAEEERGQRRKQGVVKTGGNGVEEQRRRAAEQKK